MPSAAEPVPVADFWDDACKHLVKRDRVMKKLIPRLGDGRLESRGDAFTTLARSIVGQQISVKAAQAVWDRFVALTAGPSHRLAPNAVLALDAPHIRAAGLSARKVEYLCDLAEHFQSGAVRPAQWRQMDDEAIIEELVGIRGIGRWTAEMFLIFHLLRPNVLPLDDIGLIKGISVNYFSGEPVSRAEAREVGDAWAPFRSVATWYIWRSIDPMSGQLLTMTQETFPRFRAAGRRARGEDRRAALRAERVGGRHLRRDRPPEQEEPAAHQGHLLGPDAVAGGADRAPSAAAVHARLRRRGLHRLRGAARRPRASPTTSRSSAAWRASTASRAW